MSNGNGPEDPQEGQAPGISPRTARILRERGLIPDVSALSPRTQRILQQQGQIPSVAESAEDPSVGQTVGHLFEAFGRVLDPRNLRNQLLALPGVTETLGLGERLLTGDTERTAPLLGVRSATAAGVSQGVGNAALNLGELGGELAKEAGAEAFAAKVFDFTGAAREELREFNNRLLDDAAAAGVPEEFVEDSAITGNFVGFTAPLGVAIKASRAIPILNFGRGPVGIFLRDFEIGAITGLLFEQGDVKERTLGAAREGAYFGAFGLALSAPLRFFKTFRNNRTLTKAKLRELEEQIQGLDERFDPETGMMLPREMGGGTGRTVMEVISEERTIARSQKAQDLLRNNADVEAIVQGIRDMSETGASHTVVRDVSSLEDVVPRLQREFENLTVQNVRREGGGFDLVVGPRGLSGEKLSQFSKEGRFEGQRILKNGTEYEYVRRTEEGSIVARRVDSQNTVTLKDEGIVDLNSGTPPGERVPELEALTTEFEEFVLGRLNRVAEQREDLSAARVAQAIREGRMEVSDFMKRDWVVNDAGLFAEELGGGAGGGRRFEIRPGEQLESGARAFEVTTPGGRTIAQMEGELLAGGESIRISRFEAAEELGIGGVKDIMRGMTDMFPEARQAAMVDGPQVVATRTLLERLEGEVVHPLPPQTPVTFEDLAEMFLKEQGILKPGGVRAEQLGEAPPQLIDAKAFSDFAAQNLRRRLWQEAVPEADKAILKNLREEITQRLEDAKPNLERYASTLGFSVNRLDDGRVVLRDVNTGAPLEFEGPQAAREALQGAQRNFLEQGERLIPQIGGGFSPQATKGLDLPDGPLFQAADLDPSKAPEIIPRPILSTIDTAVQRFEEATGIPLWSKVIEPLDRQAQLANANLSRKWLPGIADNFKGLSRTERVEIAEFTRRIEGEPIGPKQRRRLMEEEGFSKSQVEAAEGMRDLFNLGADEFNIPVGDFISNYYSRVVPFVEQHGVVAPKRIFPEGVPRSMEPWFRNQRTREMPVVEKDPWVVMMKWFRSAEFERQMGEQWEQAYRMVREDNPFGINDLPSQQRAEVLRMMGGQEGVKVFRQTLENTLANLRGYPTQNKDTIRRLSRRVMDKLNITTNERVLEEFASTALTSLYGSTLAARPRFVTRNMIQNLWFLYPRLGGKHAGQALERALTPEGYREALRAGAVRSKESGVFMGGELFDDVLESMPIRGQGPIGMPVAGAIRGGLRVGRKLREISRKGLVNVSTSDDLNRVWAFHWQKRHTREALQRFRDGELSEAQFFDEALPGYPKAVKDAFAERLRLSDDEALNFAAKRAADENHFIYNLWSAPPWMQKSFGKLAGMFGRWPLGAFEAYRNMVRYMTPAQKARAGARVGAMTGAVTVTGLELGVDIWNWIAPISPLTYGGGPVLDFAFDAKEMVENWSRDPARAQGAFHRLVQDVGRVSLPGSQFARDFSQSLREGGRPQDKYLLMMLGRPSGEDNFWASRVLDPQVPLEAPLFQDPERARAFEDSVGGQRRSPLSTGELLQLLEE